MSMQSFADLGVSRPVVDALSRRGITEPFPIQGLVIGDMLAGRDVLAKSPTGSGKTLAFGLPLVDRVGEDRRGAALGTLTAAFDLGFGIGGPLAGALAAIGSYELAFWVAAALAGGAALVAKRIVVRPLVRA